MKKTIKFCLIFGLILVVLGGIAAVTAFALGAADEWKGNEHAGVYSVERKKEILEEITSLELNLTAGEVIIRRGDEFSIEYPQIEDGISVSQKDGCLRIEGSVYPEYTNAVSIFGIAVNRHGVYRTAKERTLYLTVPKDACLETANMEIKAGRIEIDSLTAQTIEIQVDAGDIEAEYLETRRLDVDVSAGEFQAEDIKAEDAVILKAAMGNIEVENSDSDEIIIDCKTGNIEWAGEIDTKLEAKCDLGNVELTLTGEREDYNYDLSCDMGSMDFDGDDMESHGKKFKEDNDSRKTVKADCNMGALSIDFD